MLIIDWKYNQPKYGIQWGYNGDMIGIWWDEYEAMMKVHGIMLGYSQEFLQVHARHRKWCLTPIPMHNWGFAWDHYT
jgi:hypothetical protein